MSSISKTIKTTSTSQLCTVAAGCFWGTEHMYRKHYNDRIIDAKVGFANGTTSQPSYKEVCGGNTGHTEALQISFEPSKVSYKELIEFFFLIHDPTTVNSQGPDVGLQYRSAIFTHDDSQGQIARQVKEESQKKWYPHDKIVTTIEPIKNFWDAEEYHQEYLFKNPTGYQCPTHVLRTVPK
ncbi:DEKNAAC101484 [Brettanomyces naardenensis]|uniref:peptide-methionine (S)-S-oxide reductase n=1 Tax=Brettanomyces naardenensis TaxID=13370 RepID=A0A448YHW8_BRENA|nr:DEKNAAC101484 [Brettanomyces naardenensis]